MGSSKRSRDSHKDRKKRKKERSRSKDRERHRSRHHHKHKKHKRVREELSPSISLSDLSDFDPDVDIPIKKHAESVRQPPAKVPRRSSPEPPTSGKSGGGKDSSLSIEETNKIRAKLGLKLLEVGSKVIDVKTFEKNNASSDPSEYKAGEEVHRPPENIRDKIQVEKLREKIAAQREKRRLTGKLKTVKTLGESDDDDGGAKSWVKKSRKLDKERKEAEAKNKLLDQLDAEFGVGDLIEEEIVTKKRKGYSSKHLSGLRVQHDTDRFDDGMTTILTLKDSNILEGDEDTLQNVNLVDLEKSEKNVKLKKKTDPDDAYNTPDMDEFGNFMQSDLLTKYDEEISGVKNSSFRIGNRGVGVVLDQKEGGGGQGKKKLIKLRQLTSLVTPEYQLATEYLTPADILNTKFKKGKKKRLKKRKMLTADDLEHMGGIEAQHWGSRNNYMNPDEMMEEGELENFGEKVKSLRDLTEDDEVAQKNRLEDEYLKEESDHDDALELKIVRNRREKLKNLRPDHRNDEIADTVMSLDRSHSMISEGENNNMTLNHTDEFCRSLGEIPTYGLAGNRADEDAVMGDLGSSPPRAAPDNYGDATGTWEEVNIEDTKVEIATDKFTPILEEEPDTTIGMVNALKLAVKKGYFEKGNSSKKVNATLQHLQAVHYSIDDKSAEDDRRSRNNERYCGPTMDFREKESYRPEFKLDYVDDDGRRLDAKEAFRYLSHKFHGKGSGKNKLEKRMKKWQGELLLKSMSSIDTPLQTLERQREKQKQLGAAFLVLSGSKPQESLQVKK